MTDIFKVLDKFRADHGWRFRYVAGKWWVWDEDHWRTYDAKLRMARTLKVMAMLIWPDGHSALKQVEKDYMITRLCSGLVPYLRADTLPGDPKASRHSSEPPAPATRPEPDQLSESAPHPAVPSQELDHPDGTDGSAGHTP
jgi:hypothetical protein